MHLPSLSSLHGLRFTTVNVLLFIIIIWYTIFKFRTVFSIQMSSALLEIPSGYFSPCHTHRGNGYFSCFDVYTGRKEQREEGLSAHVVKLLTSDLKHKYHHVYFDNYFTSFQLFEDLEKDGNYLPVPTL